MPIWVGSPETIWEGQQAKEALRRQNDCRWHDPEEGTVRVDARRWAQAQAFEKRGWMHCWNDHADDRSAEHAALLDDYRAVSPDLGSVLEVG
jgi:hypothetical protein